MLLHEAASRQVKSLVWLLASCILYYNLYHVVFGLFFGLQYHLSSVIACKKDITTAVVIMQDMAY